MGLTRQWLETKPATTDKIKDGPAEFQARWKDIRELLNSAGIVCDSVNPTADQGKQAVLASGIASPDIYKSDRATKILAWADAAATLLSGYPINGSKNIPEATVADGAIGIDAFGYKRALEPLRIYESSPIDAKVNIKSGVYRTLSGLQSAIYAGGFLTVGAGALAKPAPGNHAHYAIVLDTTGTLTARKGADALYAGSPADPNVNSGDTLIATIRIREDSTNFSQATSGTNAYLIRDGRVDQEPASLIMQAGGEVSGMTGTAAGTVRATQAITTGGRIVLAIAMATFTSGGGNVGTMRIDRDGAEVVGVTTGTLLIDGAQFLVHLDNPAAGARTYTLRTVTAPAGYRLYVIEMPFSSVA